MMELWTNLQVVIKDYQEKKQEEFVTKGGIKERMHAARTGFRQQEEQELLALRQQAKQLKEENNRLKEVLTSRGIEF